ncbi:MAG: tail fiber domain-containing protein [Bacteroidota bacterium]
MKKTFHIIVFLLIAVNTWAQVPQRFNYQAVVRDNSGLIVPNEIVSFQLGILESSVNGQLKYVENHLVVTNQFGLVKLEVGAGTPVNGSWSSIDWANNSHFLRVSLDISGGNNFQFMGTSELLSVPYALVAERSAIDLVDDADANPTNEIQSLSISNDTLSISNGNFITLPSNVSGNNTDNQTLTLSGNQLSISGGNSVILTDNVDDNDSDNTNEIQQLTLSGDTLELSMGNFVLLPQFQGNLGSDDQLLILNGNNLHIESGNSIDLGTFLDNTDDQTLSLIGNQLAISEGNTVTLNDLVDDADADPANELQDLSLNGDTLSISDSDTTIDLSPYALDNDNQTLSISGNTLSIAGGNSVFIPTSTNGSGGGEDNQNLALSNDTLFIEDGNGIDLSTYLDNTDNQVLQITGDWLTIQNGNSVLIEDDVDDADADPNNEIQNIYRQGNFLYMSQDPSTVDLSPFLDNTDQQTLSYSGGLLSISNGNSINLSIDDADADPMNEIQDISLSGNSLSLSSGSTVDLSTIGSSQFGLNNGSGLVYNTGDDSTNDFVFGAPALNQDGNFNHYAKFFFDKSKFGAFRAGYVQNANWNESNVGESSFAAGYNTLASGNYSSAFGRDVSASGSNSFAAGRQSAASGFASVALGFDANAIANYSFACGNVANANGINAFAFGENVTAMGNNAIAMGRNASAGTDGIAIGNDASASQTNAIAIGENTNSNQTGSIAIGQDIVLSGLRSAALGYNLNSPSFGETSIGYNNTVYTPQSATLIIPEDRLFTIGNGANSSSLSDAFIIFKDGDAFLAGNVTSSSDLRLKRNVEPLENSLERITALSGYTYQWNELTPRDTDQINTGLIAQEVELLFPYLVSEDSNGYKSVNYIALVPHLIESIKEQSKQIEDLSRKLVQQNEIHSNLTVELNNLMKKLQVLEQQITLGNE